MTRGAVAAVLLALVLPAGAYLPPATAILKRVAQHRGDVGTTALDVRGSLELHGEAARPLAATGSGSAAPELTTAAILQLKAPSRCRLELAIEGRPPAQRPMLASRAGHVSGRGLERVPAARAILETVCALLADKGGPASEPALAQRLADQGVDLREVSLGRLGGRVAWIIGGRERDPAAQAWVDKQTFQPVRLVNAASGVRRDVRLLDFGAPPGGDRFPRVIEVWSGEQLEARFTAQNVTANPRLPDALFP